MSHFVSLLRRFAPRNDKTALIVCQTRDDLTNHFARKTAAGQKTGLLVAVRGSSGEETEFLLPHRLRPCQLSALEVRHGFGHQLGADAFGLQLLAKP